LMVMSSSDQTRTTRSQQDSIEEQTSSASGYKEQSGSSNLYEIDIPMNKQSEMTSQEAEGDSSQVQREETEEEKVSEVYYNDGATELFLALEDTDWRRALQIIDGMPEQAAVWVISTGTVETTFGWSLWRRLPLHEACRRQAPAWMISALLSSYPFAAEEATQFGELPLHLAVECGAPPEVVNLLVVTYLHGICAQDQSGRTPLEILQDSEMLAFEDHQVVFESLTRSQETYLTLLQQHADEVKEIKVRHAAGLVAIRQHHDEDLQQEQEQQEKLLAAVERLGRIAEEAKKNEAKNSEQVHHLTHVASTQKETLTLMDEQIRNITSSNSQKEIRIESLETQVSAKDQQIASLQSQVHDLQGDLQRMAGWQQDVLATQINHTEDSMQAMVEQFVGMVDMLAGQDDRLTSLLKTRNIPNPQKQQPKSVPSPRRNKTSEEKNSAREQRNIMDDETMNHIAAAATTALQVD